MMAAAQLERRSARAGEAWRASHPTEAAWIDRSTAHSFADAMKTALLRYGALTPNQLAAVQRIMAAQSAAPAPARPAASMPAVEDAFAKATAKGIKYPKLRLAGFTLSPASAASANAGAIYVKDKAGIYLGKVLGGTFSKSRDCTLDQQAAILKVAEDPKAAAIAYGKEYGACAVCGRELSDAESVARGIGPVCAERMGWE